MADGSRDGANRLSYVVCRVTIFVLLSSTRDCGSSSSRVTPADSPRPSRHVFGAILSDLDAALLPGDMDIPGYRLHPLTGDRRDQWSVRVSGNWRVVFRFMDGVATDVDLIDYH